MPHPPADLLARFDLALDQPGSIRPSASLILEEENEETVLGHFVGSRSEDQQTRESQRKHGGVAHGDLAIGNENRT